MLRSCYTSFWNLPGIGQIEGEYRFVPEGTPVYPDWNYLGSRNWHWNDGSPWPEFGELKTASQKWVSGRSPIPIPAIVLIGEQSCFGSTAPGVLGEPWQGTAEGIDIRCWRHGHPDVDDGAAWAIKVLWLAASSPGFASGGAWPVKIGWQATSDVGLHGGGAWPVKIGWQATSDVGLHGGGAWPVKIGWQATSDVGLHGGGLWPVSASWQATSTFGVASGGKWPVKVKWQVTSTHGFTAQGNAWSIKINWRATSAKHP